MKFLIILNEVFNSKKIQKAPLHVAVLQSNIDIVKLLLKQNGIDVNLKAILNHFFFLIMFHIKNIFL